MGKKSEFELVRKRRAQQRFLKRASLLGLLVVAGLALYAGWDALMRIDLTTRIEDLVASLSPGPGYPLEQREGRIKALQPLGGDLVVLADADLSVYNATGKETLQVQHGFRNPICRTAGDRVLTFDRGGKQLRVDSRSKPLYSLELQKNIYTAALSAEGSLAVAYASDQHQAVVTVFDRRFEEFPDVDGNKMGYWTWSTNNMVLDLAFCPKGDKLAVSSVDASAGELKSTITLLSTDKDTPDGEITFTDELVLSMSLDKNDRLHILTDRQAALYDSKGKLVDRMDFDRQTLRNFVNVDGGTMFFVLDDHGDNTQLTLWSLSDDFREKNSAALGAPVETMKWAGGDLYLLLDSGLFSYSPDLAQVVPLDPRSSLDIQPAGKSLYGTSSSQIQLLSTAPLVTEPDPDEDKPVDSGAAPSDAGKGLQFLP